MRRKHSAIALAILLALAGPVTTQAFAADSYTIDAIHSIPIFEFTHLGATTQSGRFDKANGKVTLDIAARKGRVEFTVETASLNMGFGTELVRERLSLINYWHPQLRC